MKLPAVPFTFTDWSQVEAVEHRGETGTSYWWVYEQGGLRVRVVEYSPGFRSDHWCSRGHVLFLLEGELTVELRDGRRIMLTPAMSFQVGDDEHNPHLAFTESGAKVLIVD
jgi:quercetin dioxygenase-like cupin family protein